MLTSLLAALSLVQIGQDPELARGNGLPNAPGEGGTRSVDIGGNYVFEYFYTWSPYYRNPAVGPGDSCYQTCVVKTHKAHGECRHYEEARSFFATCDAPCETKHFTKLEPRWERPPMESFTKRMKDWEQRARFVQTAPSEWFYGQPTVDLLLKDIQKNVMDPFEAGGKQRANLTIKTEEHFGNPCSYSRRYYDEVYSELKVKFKVREASGAPRSEFEVVLARLILPRTVPEQFSRDPECKCKEGKPAETKTALLGPQELPDHKTSRTGVWADPNGMGSYYAVDDKGLKEMGVALVCPTMNGFVVAFKPGPKAPVSLIILPGTVLESEDSKVQDMLLCSVVEFTPADMLLASISGGAAVQAGGKALCLEIDKKEPTEKSKYKLGLTKSTQRARLGWMRAYQRFGGPWDQARTWIAESGASFEAVNKRILPPISEAQYLRELRRVDEEVGVDLSEKKYVACWDPSLLAGNSPTGDLEWFVRRMAEIDPKRLAAWAKASGAKFRSAAAGSEGETLERAATLGDALCSSFDREVRLAGIAWLAAALGEGPKMPFEKEGGLMGAGQMLRSEDPAEVRAALGLFEKLNTRYALPFLYAMNAKVDAALRSRGKQLFDRLLAPARR